MGLEGVHVLKSAICPFNILNCRASINFGPLMKKLIVIIITLVYGLSSTGAIVNLDYCCGKLANISLLPVEKKDCKDDCMKAKSCCDFKQIFLKVKGEQEVSAKWVSSQKQSPTSIVIISGTNELVTTFKPINKFSTGPPVCNSSVPLFIQNCFFRI